MARFQSCLAAGVLAAVGAGQAGAINLVLDYTYDTQGFFNNPTAKATLEKAASDLSAILTDSFSAISTPSVFNSQSFNGQAVWQWEMSFDNPGVNGGPEVTLVDQTIAADEYRVFAGGRSLSGTTLGVGGPGGLGWSSTPSGGFTSGEIDQLNSITDSFSAQVEQREEPAGEFASWGGSITFDTDAATNWHYDWQTEPSAGEDDFFSVALHEMLHVLGFGTSNEWSFLASGGFSGAASVAEFGGNVPTTGGHWLDNTMSTVLRDGDAQEAAMDPNITEGTRKLLTDLDVAGLDDIGWDIDTGFSYGGVVGDTDGDGDIDDFDLLNAISNFTGSLTPGTGGKGLPEGDTDTDQDVDDFDLLTMISGFTGSLASPGGTVPEPASVVFMAAVFGLLGRRRRG